MPVPSNLTALWAKKRSHNDHSYWLPLLTHLADTSHVIVWLYANWLNSAQRTLVSADLSPQDTRQLLSFIGFFHDFGKATPTFQAKTSYQHDTQLDTTVLRRLLDAGFAGLDHFNSHDPLRQKSPHALAGEAILINHGLDSTVGAIIGGHHGKPTNALDVSEQIGDWSSNYYTNDNLASSQAKTWKAIYQDLINYGLNFVNYPALDAVPKVTQKQAIIIEGLLIMADWLASSEEFNGHPLFPLIDVNQTFNDIDEDARVKHAIQTWSVDDQWQPRPIKDIDTLFQERWGFVPHDTQRKMVNAISQIKDPGLIIIESGCGTGKTEIALAATEELAAKTHHNGLFMGLPTQATTNAMYDRVQKWLKKITTQQDAKLELNLKHSKAKLNEHAKLPEASNIESASAVVANSWFSGKKSILIEFTVATIDHLLMMGLKQKHLFLRHLAMSGKIVIIDEVHAYDAYMSSYLARTLQWLGAYHIPVIAMSATLPTKKRHEFLKNYNFGKTGDRKSIIDNHHHDQDYPLLTYLDSKTVHQVSGFKQPASTTIQITRLENNDEALINQVKKSLEHGGIAGIIVNTVRRAQNLYRQFNDIPVLLLHSTFLAPDRSHLEKKLINKIGKDANRPDKLIVIGTQVLEQSLDIDFDVLFTDIAPIDLLVQRIGRLHRHNIKRPQDLTKPHVYLSGINKLGDYDTADSYIYPNYYLTKTDYFLPSTLTLPDDTSHLIQDVYTENNDDQVPCPTLAQDHQALELKIESETRKARKMQINKPATLKRQYKTIHGWLDHNTPDSTNDAIAQATVRDIEPSIEVVLLQKMPNGIFLLSYNNHQPISQVSALHLSEQTIRLPLAVTKGHDENIINQLSTVTNQQFPKWKSNIWLRHSLALILDEHNKTKLNGYELTYSSQLGLTYIKIPEI